MQGWKLIPLPEARRLAAEALGKAAVENIINREDKSPFDRSIVDGFAIQRLLARICGIWRGELR